MTTITELDGLGAERLRIGLGILQDVARSGSVAKGFGDEGDEMRAWLARTEKYSPVLDETDHETTTEFVQARLADYYSKRLFLIVTEPVEAFDEIRSGKRAVDETYYPTRENNETVAAAREFAGLPFKPEGVPSELADTVIRCFDFADEIGVDLAAMILEKLRYNATRPAMHGRRF